MEVLGEEGQCPFALEQHTEKFWNVFFQTFRANALLQWLMLFFHHWRRALARNVWKKTFQNFSVCCAKANGHWPFSPTVLSGAEERGVDGSSLDRSYFSRVQPISFLFFDPSSRWACSAYMHVMYTVLDVAHAHDARRGVASSWESEIRSVFRPVEVESFGMQQCRRKSRHSKRC